MKTCSEITKKGKVCKNNVVCGGFCWLHTLNTCGICLEEKPRHSRKNISLDCTHVFCKNCINTWLVESNDSQCCPICRVEVNEGIFERAVQCGISKGCFYLGEVTFYNLNLLTDDELSYFLTNFRPNTMYTSTTIIEHFLQNDKKEIILEVLNETAYTGEYLIKTKDFPNKEMDLHVFKI